MQWRESEEDADKESCKKCNYRDEERRETRESQVEIGKKVTDSL